MATLAIPRTVKEQLVDHLRDDIVRGDVLPPLELKVIGSADLAKEAGLRTGLQRNQVHTQGTAQAP